MGSAPGRPDIFVDNDAHTMKKINVTLHHIYMVAAERPLDLVLSFNCYKTILV